MRREKGSLSIDGRRVKTKSYMDKSVSPVSTLKTEKPRHTEGGLSSKTYAEPEGKPSSEFRLCIAKLGLILDT